MCSVRHLSHSLSVCLFVCLSHLIHICVLVKLYFFTIQNMYCIFFTVRNMYMHACMHTRCYQNWGRNGEKWYWGETTRVWGGGETTKGENRGETTWGGGERFGGEMTCYLRYIGQGVTIITVLHRKSDC